MKQILLLSDTHGYLDKAITKYAEKADEIWHAGDIGTLEVVDALQNLKPTRAVFGNIDGAEIRAGFPLDLHFECENVKVWITHIGGYPGRYNPRVRTVLEEKDIDLFICGHSHILKVMRDKKNNLLHMNPGACGKYGFHRVRTMLRFTIDDKDIKDLEVIELGNR